MIDRRYFYDSVRNSLFDGELSQSQVDGMEAVINQFEKMALSTYEWLGYMLTTAYHETDRCMQGRPEYGKGQGKPYGIYYGRGPSGLTWERNYKVFGKRLSIDLVRYPDKALDTAIGAQILIEGMLYGLFTGKSLKDYDFSSSRGVYNARAIINGDKDYPVKSSLYKTRGEMIADHYHKFMQAMKTDNQPQITTEAVIVTEPDLSANPKAQAPTLDKPVSSIPTDEQSMPDDELAQFRQWKAEQEYRANNSKPLIQSTVTRSIVAGLLALAATKWGITIPAEYKDSVETVITLLMSAGALYGRYIASKLISGVFRAKY